MSLMKLNKNFLKVSTLALGGLTGLSSALANQPKIERKYKYSVRLHEEGQISLLLETSIYDMHENNDVGGKYAEEPLVQITNDLTHLTETNLPTDYDMMKKWEMSDTKGQNWLKFIGDRIFAITGADHTKESFWSERFTADPLYTSVDVSFLKPLAKYSLSTLDAVKSGRVESLATNLAASTLLKTYHAGSPLQYKMHSFSTSINGPRPGIIRIFPNFFASTLSLKAYGSEQFALSDVGKAHRIATLLHESRHSDGNKGNLCFSHTKCPPHHPYHGSGSCDRMQNGPYSIAMDFLKLYRSSCNNCNSGEISVLDGLILQQAQNILDPNIYVNDGNGNKIVAYLDPTPFTFEGMPTYVKLISTKTGK